MYYTFENTQKTGLKNQKPHKIKLKRPYNICPVDEQQKNIKIKKENNMTKTITTTNIHPIFDIAFRGIGVQMFHPVEDCRHTYINDKKEHKKITCDINNQN